MPPRQRVLPERRETARELGWGRGRKGATKGWEGKCGRVLARKGGLVLLTMRTTIFWRARKTTAVRLESRHRFWWIILLLLLL